MLVRELAERELRRARTAPLPCQHPWCREKNIADRGYLIAALESQRDERVARIAELQRQ